MRHLALAVIVALLGSPVAAQVAPRHLPNADAFALRLALETSGTNGVVQLRLPIEVYLASRSAGLRDLRVYNGAGQLLPFHLDLPPPHEAIEQREQAAVLFPYAVPLNSATGESDMEMELRVAPDGALQWRSHRQPGTAPATRLQELIIDLGPSEGHEHLTGLRFELPADRRDYRARLAVARSEDLELWNVAAQAEIAWLGSAEGSEQLVDDRIELPAGEGRYLRIRWLQGEPLLFAAVHGRWRGSTISDEPMLELTLAAAPGRVAGDYVYGMSKAVLATEIRLALPQQNTVMPVSLGFYREHEQRNPPWRFEPRVEATFYRLLHDGQERSSGFIQISPLGGDQWVLRLQQPDQPAPELILRWRAQRLIFNAQGEDFVLAVGADPKQVRQWFGGPAPIEQVAPGFDGDELLALEHATIGSTLAQAPTLRPASEDGNSDAARRRWTLWGVLGLGVLLLAGISWRLFRQISDQAGRD